ncbi:MAG: serine protease [Patescibacteria group bacterium]
MDYFGRVAGFVKNGWKNVVDRLRAYFKKLLFPLWLFPIKLLTYTTYYLLKFIIKLLFAFFGLIIDCIVFPFKSLKNFLKSIVYIAVATYLFFSLLVIGDYMTRQYGNWDKFFCGAGVSAKLKKSVVRIVGGNSEGSGFFVTDNQIITNFHVIDGEPSPKIIFEDGRFITPVKIIGDKDADLALLQTEDKYPDLVYSLPDDLKFSENEPLISAGYPLGTEISGKATVVTGNFIDFRKSKASPVGYIQTNLSLVPGMSGGPLIDQCGSVVGVNTQSLAGLSLFITAADVKVLIPGFTDQAIEKINVDPSASPEEAVKAFYTYLKARRMQDGFNLLSKKYLEKTNFTEWTNRFTNILDVEIFKSEKFDNAKALGINTDDTAFVKFGTKNWVDGEAEWHYYEGTWQTVKEDGVYKMLKSKIKEVTEPGWDWFYE